MITAEVSIYLRIHDAAALHNAAAKRAVEDRAFETVEEYKAEFPESEIDHHLRMLIDPGKSPDGAEILDSSCEVQNDE